MRERGREREGESEGGREREREGGREKEGGRAGERERGREDASSDGNSCDRCGGYLSDIAVCRCSPS